MSWTMVDEGWGRRAADFATLSEPANCREYVAMHHRLQVGHGDRLLDRMVAIARDRSSFRGVYRGPDTLRANGPVAR